MKEIMFEGHRYEVPDNANFMARDITGDVFWFEDEPVFSSNKHWFSQQSSSENMTFGYVEPKVRCKAASSLVKISQDDQENTPDVVSALLKYIAELEKKIKEAETKVKARSAIIEAMSERILELEDLCGEAYQVVGALAYEAQMFETSEQVSHMLDNLSECKMIHDDVLPFCCNVNKTEQTEDSETVYVPLMCVPDHLKGVFSCKWSLLSVTNCGENYSANIELLKHVK
ncbi:hypothetical protein [Escherichia phage phiWec187]|jgi:hypothetical protein|nr:hypothetical protein [Escherichia phage phiWec187]